MKHKRGFAIICIAAITLMASSTAATASPTAPESLTVVSVSKVSGGSLETHTGHKAITSGGSLSTTNDFIVHAESNSHGGASVINVVGASHSSGEPLG